VFDPDRRHLIAYLAAAAVLVVIAARSFGRDGGSSPAASISMAAPASARPPRARPRAAPPPRALIWVDVAGAVRDPGLYPLPQGARVAAALERAGGVRARADRAAVNLAAKLVDGQQVFVPVRGGRPLGAAGASASVGPAGPSVAGTGSTAGAPVSLSNGTQEQLETLDGIGPALAQRIIEYREQHGGFRSVDELQEVSGIGAKRFEALKSAVTP
jgi:competence protein ComEA